MSEELTAATPMVAQYLEIKKAHEDCLLLYRLGDFYELFYEDAQVAAKVLDLVLTKRQEMPMCGVPHHALDSYLGKLIRAGFKVAIAEQMESPEAAKARGAKAVVKREVIRIITPGTINDENLLSAAESSFLVSVFSYLGKIGAVWADISTGELYSEEVGGDLASFLYAINPKEILVCADDAKLRSALLPFEEIMTTLAVADFNYDAALSKVELMMGAPGELSIAEISAAGALMNYIELTQKGGAPVLKRLSKITPESFLEIDANTRRSLDLMPIAGAAKEFTLYGALDETVSSLGARKLASYIASPLGDAEAINQRLDMVDFFFSEKPVREGLRKLLLNFPDIPRALSRISVGRANPKDLGAIRDALGLVPKIKDLVFDKILSIGPDFEEIRAGLKQDAALFAELKAALLPDLPVTAREGGVIAHGFDAKLDELRNVSENAGKMMADLQAKYVTRSGVAGLKIKYNNIIGYFIEVPPKSAEGLLADAFFIHRQTMVSGIRFTTTELKELESEVITANARMLALELEIFNTLCAKINAAAGIIFDIAESVAKLDVAAALAEVAAIYGYRRPEVNNSDAFEIKEGRHPIVEQALRKSGGKAFIANDCILDAESKENSRMWLITGPNMAGKSTFLRQNALIAIMAHIGSFVPAAFAIIGSIDKIFSRVGSGDDIAQGRSTFMVEMQEVANIVNNATSRSLVILDEIGRGTSTYDGMAIAWSVIEYLHKINGARALISTHYHELGALSKTLSNLSLHSMQVQEFSGEVVFLYKIAPGAADRSYGIHVANLAGVPGVLTARAEEILGLLEKQKKGGKDDFASSLPLFDFEREVKKKPDYSKLYEAVKSISPDELSPKEALSIIYELQKLTE